MHDKKAVRGSEVRDDIRSDMSEAELRLKYQLSERGIDCLFDKLVSARYISPAELVSRYPNYKKRMDNLKKRQTPRADLTLPLPLYELRSQAFGIVRDISTGGFRVAGIEAEVGDKKRFRLPVDMFIHSDPLYLSATCEWVEHRGCNKKFTVAGFKIREISAVDALVLESFINLLILGISGEWRAFR
jgi:hypothetical protein